MVLIPLMRVATNENTGSWGCFYNICLALDPGDIPADSGNFHIDCTLFYNFSNTIF